MEVDGETQSLREVQDATSMTPIGDEFSPARTTEESTKAHEKPPAIVTESQEA